MDDGSLQAYEKIRTASKAEMGVEIIEEENKR